MKGPSLLIIRLALAVQFAGVLAVPTILAAAQVPQGTWMAEWLNPCNDPALREQPTAPSSLRCQANDRSMGVLTLRDNKLTFAEQVGEIGWEVALADVKRITTTNEGRALMIVTAAGGEYVAVVMDPSMSRTSPKKVLSVIERALQLQTAGKH